MWSIIGIIVVIIVISAASKKPKASPSAQQKAKEFKSCPVCRAILLKESDFCSDCSFDLRPVAFSEPPKPPKRLTVCALLALFFIVILVLCLAFLVTMSSYSEYNHVTLGILIGSALVSLIAGVSLFSYCIETQKDLNADYKSKCEAEEFLRIEKARLALNERRDQERIAEEARLLEEAREAERKSADKKAEQNRIIEENKKLIAERDNLYRKHYETIAKQSEYLREIHDNLYRFPVSVNPHPTNIGVSPVIPSITPFSDTTKLDMSDFVSIDVETTGFNPPPNGKDGIAQIAAVRFVDSVPVAAFLTKINPGIPMPDRAMRVNGLTDSMLADAPRIENVLDSFTVFIGDSPIVGFNLDFDLSFLAGYGFLDSCLKRKYISIDRDMRKYFDASGNLETLGKDYGFYCTFHRDAYDALAIGYLCSLCYLKRYDLPQSEFPSVFYKYGPLLGA